MPRTKKVIIEKSNSKVSAKTSAPKVTETSLIQKLQNQLENNQSYLSLALGLLIVFAVGVLVFNYFKQNEGELGSSTTTEEQTNNQSETAQDVSPENLPGTYTVKEGDTLYKIAEKYYNDGFKFPELMKANNITNANIIEVGQVLEIPKLEETQVAQSETLSSTSTTQEEKTTGVPEGSNGTGGAENMTIWGEKITGDTYTVVEGDWLSKIAGRAYGDIYKYDIIAKANNIQNPDLIEPGMVLKIPRE